MLFVMRVLPRNALIIRILIVPSDELKLKISVGIFDFFSSLAELIVESADRTCSFSH